MRVKQLIEILQSLEQDKEIVLITPNRDYDIVGVRKVETIEGMEEFYAIEYE
ncbi:hypothetical protein SAMN02745945_02759 [Peptoclostridium litorale DSM 5388]|uniref:Uncharacterized protein n=1 Tax=Peptoclostridium litorale DSM 5388 TaxID=1121324 RepID=A0A069RCG7_PEPLI|nr:hypothetical protein [Peptoclostridium litorale]KDR94711.1 hypothetical protein CLIT_13c00330 [Peptoclostridium litorale DSM 5388]SIO32956.1 hypothetical protein SAMN02745945_02759 [Peptoclostridium litorale DSM 5388]